MGPPCEEASVVSIIDKEEPEQVQREYAAPSGWKHPNNDSEHDWDPTLFELGSKDGG